MEEQLQLPFFQVAVSISESVFIAILLLLLMVFLSVFCLRCLKSKSEDRELLLTAEESTPGEDSTHPENHISYGTRSTTAINLPEERERTRKQKDAEIQPTSTKEVAQQSAILQQAEAQPGPAATDGITHREWLTTNDFRDVFNEVSPASEKWYVIGIQLGIQIGVLEVIRRDNRDTAGCIIAVLREWLQKEGATWKELVSALKHETVRYSNVASSITTKYIEKKSTAIDKSKYNSSAISSPVAIMPTTKDPKNGPLYSAIPYFKDLDTSNLTDDESTDLKARLRKDTKGIITDFSDLVVHMRKSFISEHVDPQALVTTLKGIAMCEPWTQSLQKSLKFQVDSCTDSIVAHLLEDNYISFINYFLVAYMIKHHGTDQDKRMLEEYKAKFEVYCKRSVFQVPQDVFRSVPSDCEKLIFKVDDDRILLESRPARHPPTEGAAASKKNETSLGDAQFILEKVAEALSLKVGNLLLVGVSRGCVELTFSAPKIVVEQIQTQLHVNGPVYRILEEKRVHLLCGPPGKPQVTKIRNIQNVGYRLQWTKPSYQGFHPIRHYKISYRSVHDPPRVWKTLETKDPMESIVIRTDEIIHPLHKSSVVFKVQAVTNIGCGIDSEESDPLTLQPLSTGVIQCYDSRSSYNAQKNIPLTGGKH